MLSNVRGMTVGPVPLIAAHSIFSGSLLRRRLLGSLIQTKGMACVRRLRIRCRQSI
jgi:hypothetical protein